MHQNPPDLRVHHATIVSDEPATTAFVIHANFIQRDIYRVRGTVVVGSEQGLFVGPVTNDEIHEGPGRIVEVPGEDFLLERSGVLLQEIEPVTLPAHLIHVDVARRNGLVAPFQPIVLVLTRRPLAIALHHIDQGLREFLGYDGEPVDVGTRLKINYVIMRPNRNKKMKTLPVCLFSPD